MRAKPMVLILIAMGCGLVATIGVSQVMKDGGNEGPKLAPVVIVAAQINIGQPLTPELVKVEQMPENLIVPGTVTKIEDIDGKYAGQYMVPGEPLLVAKMTDSNRGQAAANIPAGYRVHAIKVDEHSAVGNLIAPGDWVDVIAYLRARGQEVDRTKTILRAIRVFAVNSVTGRTPSATEGDSAIDAKTISLLVKPDQVQMLVLAEQLGRVELSLRHPEEKLGEDGAQEDATLASLLGAKGNSGGAEGASWLSGLAELARGAESPDVAAVPVDAPIPTAVGTPFQMEVMTPDGVATFQWNDEKRLPQLVSANEFGAKPEPELPLAPVAPASDVGPALDLGQPLPDLGLPAAPGASPFTRES